jgi:hypothetical protein
VQGGSIASSVHPSGRRRLRVAMRALFAGDPRVRIFNRIFIEPGMLHAYTARVLAIACRNRDLRQGCRLLSTTLEVDLPRGPGRGCPAIAAWDRDLRNRGVGRRQLGVSALSASLRACQAKWARTTVRRAAAFRSTGTGPQRPPIPLASTTKSLCGTPLQHDKQSTESSGSDSVDAHPGPSLRWDSRSAAAKAPIG